MTTFAVATTLLAHGHSPFDGGLGWWEWAIAGAAAVAAVWVIWLSIRWTLHPGEENADHVKRSILSDDTPGDFGPAGDRPGPRLS